MAGRKVQIVNVYSLNREKRTIIVCVRGRDQTGWPETKHQFRQILFYLVQVQLSFSLFR